MSRLTWRSRSVVAAGAAAVLVGTGVAALAATGSDRDDAPQPAQPGAASQVMSNDRSTELGRSVDDLMSQVDALEASLVATPTPATIPAGTSGVDDNGAGYRTYDDDNHDDSHGDDDRHGETESDDD